MYYHYIILYDGRDYDIRGPYSTEGRAHSAKYDLENKGEPVVEVYPSQRSQPTEALQEYVEMQRFIRSGGLHMQQEYAG